MPITKSAIKKQRSDKAKARVNSAISSRVKTAYRKVNASPSKETVSSFYSAVDTAVKRHVLKGNTAGRMKAKVLRAMKAKQEKSPFGKASAKASKK